MKTPSDANRYADMKLDLVCPRCGAGGLIPLRQLDRMLYCYGCQSRFGVERHGLVELPPDRIQVQVRTHSSDWEGHEAILQSRTAILGNLLSDWGMEFLTQGRGRWVLVSAVVLFIGLGLALAGRSALEKPPLEIPDSLDGRAKMFTEALAHRNMEVLIRLTDPARHRPLRIWLAHGSGIPAPVKDQQTDLNAKIVRTTFTTPGGDRADLRVQLSPDAGKQFAFDEQWAQQGGVWYFQPVRWRSPSLSKGPVQPYSKRAKH